MTIVRACVAAAAVVGLVALTPVSATALPAEFWGVVPQVQPTPEQFQRVKRGGVDSIRIPISWPEVMPVSGGVPNWTGPDQAVKGAAEVGIGVLPFVYGSPAWVAPTTTLPVGTAQQRQAWSSFLQLLVGRYGPAGSFWSENPTVPKRPIRVWQIWNEENFFYFAAKPSPAKYGKLVKISHAAIKALDPGAKILLGGMFALPKQGPPKAYPAYRFLQLMYKQTPGIKASFDGVALHPYTRVYQYLTPEIEQVRTVLKESGDPTVPLWITELGWSSGHPTPSNVFAKGPQGQVTQLKGALNALRKNQAKWKIQRVYWFSLDDAKGSCNFCDGSGLFGPGFVPKPAWSAFVKFAGGVIG